MLYIITKIGLKAIVRQDQLITLNFVDTSMSELDVLNLLMNDARTDHFAEAMQLQCRPSVIREVTSTSDEVKGLQAVWEFDIYDKLTELCG